MFMKGKLLEPYADDAHLKEYYITLEKTTLQKDWANSGIDLVIPYTVELKAGEQTILKTHVACELMFNKTYPSTYGYTAHLRSSLSAKFGLIIMNGTGIIDPNYRGGIGFIVYATRDVTINAYDRVGQLVLPSMAPFHFKLVDTLSDTSRGEGGFGSTGTSGQTEHKQ